MDELTEHQRHLRSALRNAEAAKHARRHAEIEAAQAYMRALRECEDARNAEADWRFAQARYEVGDWMAESARNDLLACNKLILDMLQGGQNHGDH